MNHLWKAVLHTAIAGAGRSPLLAGIAAQLGVDATAGAAQTAMQALAAANLLRKAAHFLAAAPEVLPPACPPDERPLCRPDAARLLTGMTRHGAVPEAVPEFFSLLHQSGNRLPPETLPGVLDYFARQRQLPDTARAALGPAGPWLAAQNSEWAPLFAHPEARWETGTFTERQALLQEARRISPLTGTAWLEKTWSQESPEHKIRFLELLRAGLSPADEPLLEKAGQDRSRPVRRLAFQLLLLLPDSRLQQEARQLFQEQPPPGKKDAALDVWLEKTIPAAGPFSHVALLALLPSKQRSASQATGPAAAILLSLLPPELPAQRFDGTPETFVSRFGEHPALLAGLLESIAWYGNPGWLDATVRFFNAHPEHPLWNSDELAGVLQSLPEPQWTYWMPALIGHRLLLESPASALVRALTTVEFPWPRALLQAVLTYPLRSERPRHWQLPPHLRQLLLRAAWFCRPEDAENVEMPEGNLPYSWHGELMQFRQTVAFRRQMWEQLSP